ncbi:3-hydroxyacyl-CoA dehydrogenase/enoyl-CoA hydratase family protein [Methanonatronarchaeum sp. AMET6-2]|uniref:3-hydroxyacyl-CoA dehydrogenase/enoyl-CoA hydratase family protein n=1 Tax=Methanonatronarchaeum sp. AMET6-2 TaxID=2933293 RepID=UPI0011F8FC35|nr:3-hydroxyacyl-CoA dehydrogenase/enoyl-CoA hydratase family protein [Methanonatronarchaeum sp. AMET6-2]RZN61711.1 MAG: 3-hydroxybutyryl-CoA dehydrogenase [Methanonatronarchaeia archaeon]UOY10133.1 3-hydroxyacyl-CoA dehydrogenase/enoyl-CoA hydratase family protein [Methanonatronarchaeum sp. AMET6-2]
MDSIDKVAVLGAGTMGHGIAEVVAISGREVSLYDHKQQNLSKALDLIEKSLLKLMEKGRISSEAVSLSMNRINTSTKLNDVVGGSDFVLEVLPEDLELKRRVFRSLDRSAPGHAILASGTSSLPITEIANATDRPDKVVGMHWFNPPVLMDLVEVIYGDETSEETAETTYKFAEKLGKTPIYCKKDVQGFIVTNIIGGFYGEAMWMVSNGEAEIKEVDSAMVYQKGYPMGPFQLLDLTGIDIVYNVRDEADLPIPPIMKEKMKRGELGRKTGVGFYNYREGGVDYSESHGEGFDTLRIEARMVNEAAKLIEVDAATARDIDKGMELGARFPEGPCRRADRYGIDKITRKLKNLHKEHGEDRYKPTELLKRKTTAGETGEKKGGGFYNYRQPDKKTYHAIEPHPPDEKGVVRIMLDRPSRMNALNQDMVNEIPEFTENLDPTEVRCIVIEGKGDRAFSVGMEVDMLRENETIKSGEPLKIFRVLENFPAPVIAKIDGYALGGGLEIALSCDIRIASNKSKFGLPEINLGIFPGGGGTKRLPELIGETRAKQMIFLGEKIDAQTAENWGLINKTVPQEKLDETTEKTIGKIVRGPPKAISIAKETINKGRELDTTEALKLESENLALLYETRDFKEGITAFKEDREPDFKGK